MNVDDFAKNYYLHDSLFNYVRYYHEEKQLIISLDFAFWMQDDYVEGHPETGELIVIFNDLSFFDCTMDIDEEADSILDIFFENDVLTFAISNDTTGDYLEMKITAKSVDVITPDISC